ncbi:MAG TPA: STAS domain-containing protein [Terriglobales bacterium]|nr:STAS domain-containing protein [Terriglobales bacterium]
MAGEGLKALQRTATTERTAGLIIDLQGVEALDAAGLGALLRVRQWCNAQGTEMKLINPKKHVREVLAVTALDSVLDLQPAEGEENFQGLPRDWACAET